MTATAWRRVANFLACAGVGGCVAIGFAAAYTTVAVLVNHPVLRHWGVNEWSPLVLLVPVVFGFLAGGPRRCEDRVVRRWCFASVVVAVVSSVLWLVRSWDQRTWIAAIPGACALVIGTRLFATFAARAASNRATRGAWIAFLAGMWTAIGATELLWLVLPRVDFPVWILVGATITGVLVAVPRGGPDGTDGTTPETTSPLPQARRTLSGFDLLVMGIVGALVTFAVSEVTSAPVLRLHDARLLHTKCLLAAIAALFVLAIPPRDDRAAFRRVLVAVSLCAAQFAVLALLQWDGPHEWTNPLREWWGLPPRDTLVRDILLVGTTVGVSSVALGVVLATLPAIVKPGSNAIGLVGLTWILGIFAVFTVTQLRESPVFTGRRDPDTPSTMCLIAALACAALATKWRLLNRQAPSAAK